MDLAAAKKALTKYFGYSEFWPLQEEVIQAIYDKKDAMVLMPTGGGKSICYQIPAVTLEGACVVVSPLISLMKDQVEGLRAVGIKAAFLNSSLNASEQRLVEDEFFNGLTELLYVSPEKLVSQNFFPLLKQSRICLFAIDEAHCISVWGHDFRPEYTKLRFLKEEFEKTPIVALTATADKLTRKDIAEQLQLTEAEQFVASFDRPNLSLEVRPGQKRFEQILKFTDERPNQSGIIYCLSRKNTESISRKLNERGINATYYHAGLPGGDRSKVQEDFIHDKTQVICATIAFGMGIDKSNVRWVIHYNLPKNIENYYQEIGRAGRDGLKADTLLFYSYGDVMILQDIINKNESKQSEIQMSKLDRMRQYAESLACRRRILLNYFGENFNENCGNCDICENPPQYFDGTTIAQKALSAIYRLRQSVGMGTVIDVLRGSGRREMFERGYNNLKTYGAGRDIPYRDWQHYLLQLLNLGYFEVATDQNNVVKLTAASDSVLFGKERVELVRMATVKERQEAERAKAQTKTKRQRARDDLFDVLRQLRIKLAQKQGVPPYLIFNDASLEEMAAERPLNELEMRQISGVGEHKLKLYGQLFIAEILSFVNKKSSSFLGSTFKVTLELYKQGMTPEEIAKKREKNLETIYGHFIKLYQSGEEIALENLIKEEEIKRILAILPTTEEPFKLKPIFESLNEEVPYYKIRLALAFHQGQVKEE